MCLIESEKAGEFPSALSRKYLEATGIEPEIYPTRPDDGAGLVDTLAFFGHA